MKIQNVVDKPGENAFFLVYKLIDTPETVGKVKSLCGNFAAFARSMKNRYPDLEVNAVMGFGAEA